MNDFVDVGSFVPTPAPVPNDLALDYSKYSDELSNAQIPDEKVRELLEALWGIMRLFVECGFSIDVSGKATMEIFNRAARGSLKDEA